MCGNTSLEFRRAEPQDVEGAWPLIYSSGPKAIDYCFRRHNQTSADFLRFAFTDGKGFLGYQIHTVATTGGQVVGIAAFYNFSTYVRLTLEHMWQLWRFYPALDFADLAIRGSHLQSVMHPPAQDMHYVANFGVAEKYRSQGIGRQLLDYQRHQAFIIGRTRYALDVSVDNPHAQALYARYGFNVEAENQFSGPSGAVPNTRRMTMPLSPVDRDVTNHQSTPAN